MKNIIAPNAHSLRSAHQIFEDAGAAKQKKSVGWEMRRRVPVQVALNLEAFKRERATKGYPIHD